MGGVRGVSRGKRQKSFEFFLSLQKPYRIILGPPKHVLHLVWGVLGISTAIKTALKVALYDFFDGLLAPLNGQFMEKVKIMKFCSYFPYFQMKLQSNSYKHLFLKFSSRS